MVQGGDSSGQLGDIVVPAGTNSSTGVLVTFTSTPCQDAAGTKCEASATGAPATGLELLCGNNALVGDTSVLVDFPYSSGGLSSNSTCGCGYMMHPAAQ